MKTFNPDESGLEGSGLLTFEGLYCGNKILTSKVALIAEIKIYEFRIGEFGNPLIR